MFEEKRYSRFIRQRNIDYLRGTLSRGNYSTPLKETRLFATIAIR